MSPPHRLTRFFTTLHAALKNPSRAVLQFYPSSDDQIALITSIAQRAGFGGGLVVDYPNSKKAKKVFLCLMVGGGGGGAQNLPKGLDGEDPRVESEGVAYERRRARERRRKEGKRSAVKDKDWILKKKEVIQNQLFMTLSSDSECRSYIGKGERTTSLEIQSTLAENGRHSFK
jgi:18S rRNA (guanine1575-N7)-methyltransferase